ncbi:MAG TPA: molecular chaperone TorD family protein [Thiobacillaceae bacterium]|nr:molecular chaperone TorD family protein [Thiobacillaceae bacterium]HNU65428.1 molecular chaperone TorD family protein [Thiobacillaceae bacterium]
MSRARGPLDPLWRASLLQVIARGFHYPADAEHAGQMCAALAGLTSPPPAGLPAVLKNAIRQVQEHWGAVHTEDGLASAYSQLFLNNALCSMYETAYSGPGGVAGRTHEIADISGFYLAFGLRSSDVEADRPDHLCAELEFLSILLLKWVHAREQAWNDRGKITVKAIKSFLTDHLGRWYGAFAMRLGEQEAPAVYHALAALLVHALDAECRAWNVQPLPMTGEIAHDSMQEDQLICPKAAAEAEGGDTASACMPM